MAITQLHVANFRCIQKLDLELPRFAALIGPNGAGKSTLLGTLRALHEAAQGKLSQVLSAYGGFAATICRHSVSSRIGLGARIENGSETLNYSMELSAAGTGYIVAREQIPGMSDSDKPQGFHQKGEAFLPDLASKSSQCGAIVRAFRGILSWDSSGVQLQQIRRPQALAPAELPSPTGDNLLSVLYGLKADKRETYEELVSTLRVACPDLETIELPLAGKGYASLSWYQKGEANPLDAQELSDGTLRLLWLVTLLHTVPDDGLVLIDEPEISMHPQWLQFLASLMRHMSLRTQILVATHSDQFIRWLEPHELLVANLEDGVSSFRWGHEMDLEKWLEDYTLDRLWLMGELGGRR